ncbi:hypothetical protein ACKF11_12845 [Methylobacillus sp. Pita2]|uniref:hypothetical protein n=1 Tax=Methylobacillus sp. Pita2 TaxID=3383245 RepID=UPI0038B5E4C4
MHTIFNQPLSAFPKGIMTAILAYHGSGTPIQSFDYQYTDIGNDQEGSGFYFTTSRNDAIGYCTRRLNGEVKPGGMLHPTLHEVSLNISNPIHRDLEMVISKEHVKKIILNSPMLDEALENWGDVNFTPKDDLINEALDAYVWPEPYSLIKQLNMLSNDFYKGSTKEFFDIVRELLGFDGVVSPYDDHTHYVAWFPEQVEIHARLNLVEMKIQEAGEVLDDPLLSDYMLLYHGTDMESAENIINHGVDINKCTKGYFGQGFYLATNVELAIANYADFSGEDGAVIAFVVPSIKDVLDLREVDDSARYTEKLSKDIGSDQLPNLAIKNGIDGVFDRSFGGVVIYNPNAITPIGLVHADTIAQIKAKRSSNQHRP